MKHSRTTVDVGGSPRIIRRLDDGNWPEFSSTDGNDLWIAGVSLLRLVDCCGTPCVHTVDESSVVVTRVIGVSLAIDGSVIVTIDAELDGCRAELGGLRMIGRDSDSVLFRMLLRSAADESNPYLAKGLPADLEPGDLIAIPCRGLTALHDIRVVS
jgi:hypothetical protein